MERSKLARAAQAYIEAEDRYEDGDRIAIGDVVAALELLGTTVFDDENQALHSAVGRVIMANIFDGNNPVSDGQILEVREASLMLRRAVGDSDADR